MKSRRFYKSTRKRRVYTWKRTGQMGMNRMAMRRYRVYKSATTTVTHNFKRTVRIITGASTGTGPGGGTYFGAFSPSLSQLPNVSEFGALFDQYRINFVVYRIIWRSTALSAIETANNQNMGAPYILWTLDRDDVSLPTDPNTIREYATCKEFMFTPDKRVCYIKFKPNTLQQIYQSAIATSYSVNWKRWVDIADGGNTPYYGCKFAIITPNSGSPTYANLFDVEATFYFQTRVPR